MDLLLGETVLEEGQRGVRSGHFIRRRDPEHDRRRQANEQRHLLVIELPASQQVLPDPLRWLKHLHRDHESFPKEKDYKAGHEEVVPTDLR